MPLFIKKLSKLLFDNVVISILIIIIIIIISSIILSYKFNVKISEIGHFLGGIGLLSGAFIALYRWVIETQQTALKIFIYLNRIKEIDNAVLIAINVKLENKGEKRIVARRYKDVTGNEYLQSFNGVDVCVYAGTLKIRKVPVEYENVQLFDWYSLEPIAGQLILKDLSKHWGDFEQINYLDGYEVNGRDVDFFIEANESYNQQVMVLLLPGTYAIKAFFLGKLSEEYWSCTKIIII